MKLTRRRTKKSAGHILGDLNDEMEAKGSLFPRFVVRTLLVVFAVSAMLAVDWFGLMLLNAEGVEQQMGILNVHRVTAALMSCIAISSILLMIHYRRVHSYVTAGNVFFAITFSLSFMMGMPSVLAVVFGS